MNLVRTITINLHGQRRQIEAEITRASYTIFAIRDAHGCAVSTTCDDLDEIERQLDQVKEDNLDAIDPDTGSVERFCVVSLFGNILWILREDGSTVRRSSPAYTEAAECWHIDREYREAVESEEPRAAALAGYIHPKEWPHSSGHGLHRAA